MYIVFYSMDRLLIGSFLSIKILNIYKYLHFTNKKIRVTSSRKRWSKNNDCFRENNAV